MAKLSILLEEDREMFMNSLEQDPSLKGAETAAEKELERAALRGAQEAPSAQERDRVQYLMAALKSAVPLIASVGGVKMWERQTEGAGSKKPRALPTALLAAGALLIAATVLALALTGKGTPNILLCTALPAAGFACVLWAGVLIGRPEKKERDETVRAEYTVDREKLWHDLKAMMLVADNTIASMAEDEEIREQAQERSGECGVSDEELELFSTVLEKAYAAGGQDMKEAASAVRFYLHGRGIETEDLTEKNASRFEILPAVKTATIRPALLCGGKLLRKGLASRAEN